MASIAMRTVEPLIDCSDGLQERERLLSYADENGYRYFPCLLSAQEVLQVRHEVLHVAGRHGLLREATSPDDAFSKDGVYVDVEYERDQTCGHTASVASRGSFAE